MRLCPGCGFAGGREACQNLFNDIALRVRAIAWTDSMKTWRLMHDVYDIQHEEDFCGRYKGLVVHLGGVCWALEHGGAQGPPDGPSYWPGQKLALVVPSGGQPVGVDVAFDVPGQRVLGPAPVGERARIELQPAARGREAA